MTKLTITPAELEKYIAMFKVEVDDLAKVIDPTNELDWYSLVIGWALAKGMGPENAERFSAYIRYQTELG